MQKDSCSFAKSDSAVQFTFSSRTINIETEIIWFFLVYNYTIVLGTFEEILATDYLDCLYHKNKVISHIIPQSEAIYIYLHIEYIVNSEMKAQY